MKPMRMPMMLVLAFAAAACATPFGSGGDGVRLENESGNAVLYLALSLEQSYVFDPNPEWRIEEHLERLLEPGETREIRPEGYSPGEGLVFLIYDVPGPQRSGPVSLSRILRVSHRELAANLYRVTIPPRE